PECRHAGRGGASRIGNRRNKCTTCNNFAQNVMRMTRKRLLEAYAEEYQQIRWKVELDLYPQVIEDYVAERPWLADEQTETAPCPICSSHTCRAWTAAWSFGTACALSSRICTCREVST